MTTSTYEYYGYRPTDISVGAAVTAEAMVEVVGGRDMVASGMTGAADTRPPLAPL